MLGEQRGAFAASWAAQPATTWAVRATSDVRWDEAHGGAWLIGADLVLQPITDLVFVIGGGLRVLGREGPTVSVAVVVDL